MFDFIKNLFRRGAASLIGTPDLFKALEVEVPISKPMQDALALWIDMHSGKLMKDCSYTMGIPAVIVRELARLAAVEITSEVTGSRLARLIDEPYQNILIKDAKTIIEFASARGDMVFKPYMNNGKPEIAKVKAGDHYSLAFNSNGQSTSELFLDWRTIDDKIYVRGEIQEFTGDSIIITNKVLVKKVDDTNYKTASLSDVDEWRTISPKVEFGNIKAPLWGLFKMPFANTVDPSSPLGVAAYSAATPQIMDADKMYSILNWELDSGKRKLFVDHTATERDSRNNLLPLADEFIVKLENGVTGFFEDYSPEFRDASIINACNFVLGRVEANAGLSQGSISRILTGQERTATEVLSSDRETAATVQSIRDAFKTALEQTVYAMSAWATIDGLAPLGGTVNHVVEFGDGIVLSDDERRAIAERGVSMGQLDPAYLSREYAKIFPAIPEDEKAVLMAAYSPDAVDAGGFEGEQ